MDRPTGAYGDFRGFPGARTVVGVPFTVTVTDTPAIPAGLWGFGGSALSPPA
jgi:hypothetical protein